MKRGLFLLLLVFVLYWRLVSASEKTLSVIAHPSVSVNHLSVEEIKNIYLLRDRKWSNDMPIVVVNRPSDSEIRQRFEQTVLETTKKKYALHIERLHYQGVSLPVIQESTQAAIAFVQNVPGAIAYIEGSPNNDQVKVLMELK